MKISEGVYQLATEEAITTKHNIDILKKFQEKQFKLLWNLINENY